MTIRSNTGLGLSVHPGNRAFTDVIGLVPDSCQEAEKLAADGITMVEFLSGKWLAARHYHQAEEVTSPSMLEDANALAQSLGFKSVIPTDWREISRDDAIELKSRGANLVEYKRKILVSNT